MNDQIQWIPVIASLIGGGFAGAVLTNVISAYRARIQPIGRRIDVAPLFTPGLSGSTLRPTVTLADGDTTYPFTNLYVAEVQVVNRGNKDFKSFSFGLTLAGGDAAAHVEAETADRHHVVSLLNTVTPSAPSQTVDLAFTPFNRGDAYILKVFVVAAAAKPGPISVSSTEAIRFTDIPSLAERLTEIASTQALKFGPFQLSFR